MMWVRVRRKIFFFFFSLSFGALCTYRIFHLQNNDADISSSQIAQRVPKSVFGKDIHVVIGYYQGNNYPWVNNENLTDEILNTNMYREDPEAGMNGEAVLIPAFESPKMNKLFQINRFNLMASDKIPLNRSLPDVRRKICQKKNYGSNLPDTTIIVVFHNEAWSTLMRTVHSVINRSPKNLIREIILVDDASQRNFLKEPLEEEVRKLPVEVRVLRSNSRIGLIKARLLGAKEAKGKVLTFLDAHCECTEGWLEPLLDRIGEDRKSIVSPVIDIINDETFQYVRSFELHQGGFNWELHFRWFSLPSDLIAGRSDPTVPFETPVMAGGLFSIEKDFFYELGAYDDQMEIWGGENLEISLRGWMCGAKLEISPCSHVGHLFRKSSPYTFPGGVGDVLHSNLARLALVWMDEWKEFYFKLHPEVAKHAKNQSVIKRIELREKMNCKSFGWFLSKVWPTHFFPAEDRWFGKVRNLKSGKCLQSPRTKTFGQPYGLAGLSECIVELYGTQLFVLSPEGYLRTDDSVCLDAPEYKAKTSEVRIMACNTLSRQKWTYEKAAMRLKHKMSQKCLDLPAKPGGPLVLNDCKASKSQEWILEDVKWKS